MLDFDAGRWLPLLTDAAVKSAAVLTVTSALFLGLRRASAATRHLVLLAGIAVLLGLPLLMLFVPRQDLPQSPAPPARIAAAPVSAMPLITPAPTSQAADLPAPPLSRAPCFPPPAVASKPRISPLPHVLPAWIVFGWLTGVLLYASRVLAAQARIWRLIRRCSPLTSDWLSSAGVETAPFGRLQTSPPGTPPMVWGWPRPTLLLPSDAAQWPEARLRAVLWHEAAHVRRQDWLTQTLTQAACALYWFNPLVWLTASRMQAEAEQACDDAVLLAGVPPADYAQDLLAVARSLTSAQRASLGAVTMAQHSPVRTRLEAILDPARPRRRTTPRAAALALTIALAVALPLAALRPAARAAAPTLGQPAPPAGVPTEADVANVQRHLQSLERDQTVCVLISSQPNMLTAAQTAEVDEWAAAMEFKRQHESDVYLLQLKHKVDALPEYQVVLETRMYAFDSKIALDKTKIEAMQMERAEGYSLHLSQADIASEASLGLNSEKHGGMSRADSVHLQLLFQKVHQQNRVEDADLDSLIAILREPKAPSAFSDVAHENVMSFFRWLPHASPAQQEKIREAVTPFLTSPSKWSQMIAKQVLKKYGGNVPTPPQSPTAQPTPSAALPAPSQPKPTGVFPMPPLKTLKAALMKTAALTTLAVGLTPNIAHAQPVTPVKPVPAVPVPNTAPATDAFHWYNISLHHANVGNNPAFARWRAGKILPGSGLPEGVMRLFFLTSNNSILVQATAAGFAKMQEIIKQADIAPQQVAADPTASYAAKKLALRNIVPDKALSLLHWNQGGALPEGVNQITSLPKENALLIVATPAGFAKVQEIVKSVDVAPRQVQVKVALANVPQTTINALGVNFVLVPQNETKENSPSVPLQYLDGNIAAELFKAFTRQGRVVEAPVITTTSNVAGSINISGVQPNSTLLNLNALRVTPRVNSDDSVTLLLHWTISLTTRQGTTVKTIQEINALRTIRSGDTLALSIASPKSAGESDHSLLLFVSPIIIGESSHDVTVKDSAGNSITVSL